MPVLLFLIAMLAFFAGVLFFMIAKSAIHEIAGLLCWLICAVCFSGAAIVAAVNERLQALQAGIAGLTGIAEDSRRCPYGAEAIRVQAVKCRYCQSELVPLASTLDTLEAHDTAARHPLNSLSPQRLAEAQDYVHTLTAAGHPYVIKRPDLWEITTPAGRVAYTVATLEELRAVAAGQQSDAPTLSTPLEELRDNDTAYLAWLSAHGDGFVLQVYRHRPQSSMVLHQAMCPTIGQPGGPRGRPMP